MAKKNKVRLKQSNPYLYYRNWFIGFKVAKYASILAPLLLLFSLRTGVLNELEQNLVLNPTNLEITFGANYRLDKTFIKSLEEDPHVGFVVPLTRSLDVTCDVQAARKIDRAALLLLQQDKAVGLEGGFAGVGLAGQQVGVAAGRQGDGVALAAEVEQADQLFPFGLAPDAEDGKAAGVEGVDGGRRLKGGILPPDRFQLLQPGKDAAGRAGAVCPLGGARPGH